VLFILIVLGNLRWQVLGEKLLDVYDLIFLLSFQIELVEERPEGHFLAFWEPGVLK